MADAGLGARRGRPRSRAGSAPIDVLVNNAGTDRFAFFVNTDEELWDLVLGVNLRGVLAVTHAVLPAMQERRGGSIVNVASEAGRVGSQGSAVYSAAKAGVIGFTKAIAREARALPRALQRRRAGADRDAAAERGAADARRARRAPEAGRWSTSTALGRSGEPEEVAAAIAFLASRRRLLRHRPDAERQRRPVDVVSGAWTGALPRLPRPRGSARSARATASRTSPR